MAGLFKSKNKVCLIIQNASTEPRLFNPADVYEGTMPKLIETLSMPDLTSNTRTAPPVTALDPAQPVILPAYSVTRIVWK
jgi:hypothetical protein